MHHVLMLLQQPELKAQFQTVEQVYQQLTQWDELAQANRTTRLRIEEIRATTVAFLDGEGISRQIWRAMQEDLARSQQSQRHQRDELSL